MRERFLSSFVTAAAVLFVTWLLAPPPAVVYAQAQTNSKGTAPAAPAGPAPHLANGRVDFSGLWRPADIFLIEDISLGLKKGETSI